MKKMKKKEIDIFNFVFFTLKVISLESGILAEFTYVICLQICDIVPMISKRFCALFPIYIPLLAESVSITGGKKLVNSQNMIVNASRFLLYQ